MPYFDGLVRAICLAPFGIVFGPRRALDSASGSCIRQASSGQNIELCFLVSESARNCTQARTHARLRNGVCAPSRCATSASLHWSRWQGPIPPETPAFCARERHLICRLCRRERRGDVPALRPSRGAPSSCAGRLGEAVLTGHRFRAPDFRSSTRGGSRLRGDREAPRKPLCAHAARDSRDALRRRRSVPRWMLGEAQYGSMRCRLRGASVDTPRPLRAARGGFPEI